MRLLLAGDVMLGRLVNQALRAWPPETPWGDTLSLFRQADWSFCNLECVISDYTPSRLPDKAFHFRSDRRNVAVLQAAGINAVSIANNHSLDFGPEAMLDMIATLDAKRIGHAGAGANLEQAMRPALSRTKDRTTIGVLACTDNEPRWAAGVDKPGVWFVPVDLKDPRTQELLERVGVLKKITDLACVSLHWGSNWGRAPEPGHRELARALTDAGADVVFGHSCHVFRGVEMRNGSLIMYSAGNFVDDYAIDPYERNDESFLFNVEADRGAFVQLELVPTLISECRAVLAEDLDATRILNQMRQQSARLGTQMTISESKGMVTIQPSLAKVSHG
jgi:poly-gamma-glutamate capsule biosynthesis protein CapA/YwtB (metallophosphatase superfamily)